MKIFINKAMRAKYRDRNLFYEQKERGSKHALDSKYCNQYIEQLFDNDILEVKNV